MGEAWDGVLFVVGASGDEEPVTRLALGVNGWVFLSSGPNRHEVRARIIEDQNGRVLVNTLWIWAQDTLFGPGYLTPLEVRDIGLGRLEQLLNSPDLLPMARRSLRSDQGPDFDPQACTPGAASSLASQLPMVDRQRVLMLAVPYGKRKSDEFYKTVATKFAIAAQSSSSPAKDVADANGLPASTVHQWIKEARRRGLLPPGRRTPGAAGSGASRRTGHDGDPQ